MATQSELIDSLLIERAGYLRVGKGDRAAQVTAELRKLGYEDPAAPAPAEASPAARGRRTTKA